MELVKDLSSKGQSVIIYANPGMGKTTALSMLPGKTLIIDVDRGTSVLKDAKNVDVVRLKDDLSNLRSIVDELKQNKHGYQNVCLDTISELETAMLTMYGRTGKNDGAPELSHYGKAKFKISDYIRELRNLVEGGTNIVFTAWEQSKDVVLPSGEKYSQVMPMIRAASEICGMVDVVAKLEMKTLEDKTQKRYFRLQSDTVSFAKDRINKRTWCEIKELITCNTIQAK